MGDLAIKLRGISKKYFIGIGNNSNLRETLSSLFSKKTKPKELWALKDISFEIKKGEVIGIIGNNGAGKSTLLKVLSKITYPSYGSIELYGRVASLLEVGTGFHPELTGRENIFLNGSILGMKKREIKNVFSDIVEFSGMQGFIDMPVKRYSSGMFTRLAFSVAAYLESDIMLIDEVLGVGDIKFQEKSLSKMESVAHSGKTAILVSHNLLHIEKVCSKVLVLDSGKISFLGNTKDGIRHYLNNIYGSTQKINLPQDSILNFISFIDSSGNKTDNLSGNSSALLMLVIHNKRKDFLNLRVDLGINNIAGLRVSFLTGGINSDQFLNEKDAVTFLFNIENIPFCPDRYTIDVFIENQFGKVFHAKSIYSFYVFAPASSELIFKNRGVCLLKYKTDVQ